ncbi:hypothetical protein JD844_000414, partial [Phrynosoma platyrhinos]
MVWSKLSFSFLGVECLCLLSPVGAAPAPNGEVLHSFPAPGLLERRIMKNAIT